MIFFVILPAKSDTLSLGRVGIKSQTYHVEQSEESCLYE
jgi:hypothetical protein